MKTIKEIKETTNLYYDSGVIEDEGRQIFQSDEDGYIYVLNTNTKRAGRYNAEGLNGKRISVDEFESKLADMLLRIAKQGAEESTETEEIREIAAEMTSEEAEEAHESAQATEGSSSTALAPQSKEKPKKKASRAKKTAAFAVTVDGTEVTLTEKQVDFIRHLPDTGFWERGVDSCIWVDCLCDDIGGQFENKPMTVGAMISTLCEKGLGARSKERVNGRKCTAFELTGLGKVVAAELGLK